MSCRKYQRYLALQAGDDLSNGRARRLSRHLKRCVDCREELAALKRARARLESLAGSSPAENEHADLTAEVMAAWRRDRSTTPAGGGWGRRLSLPRAARWGLEAALLLLVVAGAIHIVHRSSGNVLPGDQSPHQPAPIVSESTGSLAVGPPTGALPLERSSRPGSQEKHVVSSPPPLGGIAEAETPVPTARMHLRVPVRTGNPAGDRATAGSAPRTGPMESFTVKLETPDPRVVIYWTIETRKGADIS